MLIREKREFIKNSPFRRKHTKNIRYNFCREAEATVVTFENSDFIYTRGIQFYVEFFNWNHYIWCYNKYLNVEGYCGVDW